MNHLNTRLILFLSSAIFFLNSYGQDINYVKRTIDTLCSPSMHGRGYVNKGDRIAAKFLEDEFKKIGLKKFRSTYFQKFKHNVNTFPGKTVIKVNNTELIPGKDFIIIAGSTSCKGTFELFRLNKALLDDSLRSEEFKKMNFSDKIIVVDDKGMDTPEEKSAMKALASNPFHARGIIMLTDNKFTWSVSGDIVPYLALEIQRNVFPTDLKSIEIEIENKFEIQYRSSNVIGFIPGYEKPDSFIVFSAHYDHLGRMGQQAIFSGANDNASGTAMMLDIARHYSKNKPKYSMVFMAFAAEEAGLIGSKHYTENPLFPLNQIKFLINLDLMSNGDEGITVVNGSIFEKEFNLLSEINAANNLVPVVKKRGKAANSDHYHFSEKGVRAIFIYTLGGGKAYHDIYDTPDQLKHPKYSELFKLFTEFVSKL